MCCFSGRVLRVSGTEIFARGARDGQQILVYRMNVKSAEPVAMVLPLPVPLASAEGAVRFIDLSSYPEFFVDMRRGFERPPMSRGRVAVAAGPLQVVVVGSFEASFVPTVDDFDRLDERFRLSSQAWDTMPEYRDWGFAVFQLHNLHADRTASIEPMAFGFPRRDPTKLFFPTVHVHDGIRHPEALYDHKLYYQSRTPTLAAHLGDVSLTISASRGPARTFMRGQLPSGLVDADDLCHQISLGGPGPNQDTWATD